MNTLLNFEAATSPEEPNYEDASSIEEENVTKKIIVKGARYGQGVFALKDLEEDTVLGRVRGLVTSEEDIDPDYCIHLAENLYMIPGPPFRFLNHSCEPNCELFVYEKDPLAKELGYSPLFVATTKEVTEGEELTIDYGWPAEFAIPCGCGAKNCRGWIVCEEELDLIPPQRQSKESNG